MFYHLLLVATPSNVVIKTNDTDNVIAMRCKQFYDTSMKLWLEVRTQSKIQSGILVLIRHVKNLVYHYAMRYQFFMPLQGLIIKCLLKGKGISLLLSCWRRAPKLGRYLLKWVLRFR